MRISALHRDMQNMQSVLVGKLVTAGANRPNYNSNELGILTENGHWYALGKMEGVWKEKNREWITEEEEGG